MPLSKCDADLNIYVIYLDGRSLLIISLTAGLTVLLTDQKALSPKSLHWQDRKMNTGQLGKTQVWHLYKLCGLSYVLAQTEHL